MPPLQCVWRHAQPATPAPTFTRAPRRHCTDNGVMVAWAGCELVTHHGLAHFQSMLPSELDFSARAPLGPELSRAALEDIAAAGLG